MYPDFKTMKCTQVVKRLLRTFAIVPVVPLVTAIVFLGHGKALTAGVEVESPR